MNYFAQQKWLKWAFFILLVLNIAILSLLFKDQFKSHKGHHPSFKSPKDLLQETVVLSDEQLSAYETMISVHQAVSQDIREQLISEKIEYFKGLGLETPEEREKQLQDILKLQRKLEDLTYRHFLGLRETLTAEQQKKFDDIIPEVLSKMIQGPKGPLGGPPKGHLPPPPRH